MLDVADRILSAIGADLAREPPEDHRVIFLGDYIDRGPDSRGVLERVRRETADPHVHALLGNHDRMLLDALADPEGPAFHLWLMNGGEATLASYGIPPPDPFTPQTAASQRSLAETLRDAMGPGMLEFLAERPTWLKFGDYIFVHAGLRPGVPLEEQSPHDLLWIRDDFLRSGADFGGVVVHGHTPSSAVEIRANRIGIDTGAVFGGTLTCLRLERTGRWLLDEHGHRRLHDQ